MKYSSIARASLSFPSSVVCVYWSWNRAHRCSYINRVRRASAYGGSAVIWNGNGSWISSAIMDVGSRYVVEQGGYVAWGTTPGTLIGSRYSSFIRPGSYRSWEVDGWDSCRYHASSNTVWSLVFYDFCVGIIISNIVSVAARPRNIPVKSWRSSFSLRSPLWLRQVREPNKQRILRFGLYPCQPSKRIRAVARLTFLLCR